MVTQAWFVQSQGCFSGNSSTQIPELTITWCSISRTLGRQVLVNHRGIMLRAVINWSCCSLSKQAVHYLVSWWPFTMVWIYSHPTACCFWFMLLSVLQTIYKFASWVLFWVAILAVVLATGPNSRVSSGSRSTRNRIVATCLTPPTTWTVGNGPVLPPQTRHLMVNILDTNNLFSSDRIMTWSVHMLCNISRCFTSRC
jgi:hypothetical protein